MPTWTRPKHEPGGADARVALIAYTTAPLAGMSASMSRHGVPQDLSDIPVRLDHFARADGPLRFAELRAPALLRQAVLDCPGLSLSALEQAPHQVCLQLTQPDPQDLEYLRICWSLMRAVCDAVDVLAIIDVPALRWWSPDTLQQVSIAASFDLRREIRVVSDVEASDHHGFVVHTRGMRKFGRPDLILVDRDPSRLRDSERVLRSLAGPLAQGARYRPGAPVLVEGGCTLERYVPDDNAPDLHLDNAAWVVRGV